MSELLQVGIALAVIIVVVGIVLHSKLSAVHAAALAPVSIALVPVSSAPAAAVASAPAAPVDAVAAKWQALRAKYGDDLWAVQAGENVSLTMADMAPAKAAGFTKTDDFAAKWADVRPVVDPGVDPYIMGDRFDFARPGVQLRSKGAATKTLPIPADFKGFVRIEAVPNSDTLAGPATWSVGGSAPQEFPNQSFGTGPFAVLAVGVPAAPNEIAASAGDCAIAISVACDLTFRVMPA